MNEKDLRVQKTEKALLDAMAKLMEIKTIEQITVNELCCEAQIRRATFYKHYEDKYDLLSRLMEKFQMEWDELYQQSVANQEHKDFVHYLIYILRTGIDFFEDHQKLVKNFLASSLSSALLVMLIDRVKFQILNYAKEHEDCLYYSPEYCDIVSTVLSSLFFVIALWHLKNPKISKDEIIQWVDSFLKKKKL